ncbi:hypothetical protein ACHAW5_011300 [Stephanodiscus triporus]|uniref:tRNA/rRNA methyltransferase SpoU type domain-containing protein n=1 Tax=Stephanodiscus triporus TaxID=2934178 RepID=A0ABD3ML24_9STRA
MRLRAIVNCDFVLGEVVANDEGANSKRGRRVGSSGRVYNDGDADNGEYDENAASLKAAARRMAHHVHMLADVADYLHPFGFRLERQSAGGASGRNGDGGGRAAFHTPRPPRTLLPFGTIRLRVEEERLMPTVGPLLRTCVRLSHPGISPMRLRAIVNCDFVLGEVVANDEGANSKRGRRVGSSGRVYNDGDADNGEYDENAASLKAAARRMAHHVHMLVRNSMGSALCLDLLVVLPRYRVKERIPPLSSHSVELMMQNNPDACYSSVRLVARAVVENTDVVDCGGNRDSAMTTLDLSVRTRMCTVRHSPTVFQFLYSLLWTAVDFRSPSCRESICPSEPPMHRSGEGTALVPIVVACIEKVANLHRVLMLCHDLGGTHCDDAGYQNVIKTPFESFLSLSDVVVVLPNIAGAGEQRDNIRLREFEDAVNKFHEVVVGADRERGGSHRPTFAHEKHAAVIISNMIEQRYPLSSLSPPHSSRSPSMVAIDLHPSALNLDGGYRETGPISPALHMIRNADAIVFGYESTGIPKVLADSVNGWVQIPSRSSINVVSAMSIVLDALLGVGKC